MDRGATMLEVLVVAAIAAVMGISLMQLSSQNLDQQQETLERSLAQGLCLDMVDRFKRYKSLWPLPGTPAQSGKPEGPPLVEMCLPVEMNVKQWSLFDQAYLDNMARLKMSTQPQITRTPDPSHPGLFRLEISIAWKGSRGRARKTRFVRYCFAP